MIRFWVRSWALLAMAILLVACPEKNAVWVEDGSTATNLTFGVGSSRDGRGPPLGKLPTLAVVRCVPPGEAEDVIWQIAVAGPGEAPVPTRIRYGEPPRGYVSQVGPGELTPGCYEARTMGTGRVRFEVEPNGTVRAS